MKGLTIWEKLWTTVKLAIEFRHQQLDKELWGVWHVCSTQKAPNCVFIFVFFFTFKLIEFINMEDNLELNDIISVVKRQLKES